MVEELINWPNVYRECTESSMFMEDKCRIVSKRFLQHNVKYLFYKGRKYFIKYYEFAIIKNVNEVPHLNSKWIKENIFGEFEFFVWTDCTCIFFFNSNEDYVKFILSWGTTNLGSFT